MSIDTIKTGLDYSRLEIMKVGSATLPSLSVGAVPAGNFSWGTATNTIAHGLGFAPLVISFEQNVNSNIMYNDMHPATSLFGIFAVNRAAWLTRHAYADSTNVYLEYNVLFWGDGGLTVTGFTIQYYLLREVAKRTS
jgi:hypothetical protein